MKKFIKTLGAVLTGMALVFGAISCSPEVKYEENEKALAAVTSLTAMYSFPGSKVTLNWVNPAVEDLAYVVVNATFGGTVVADNVILCAPASSYVVKNIVADNNKEFSATVKVIDELGNDSPVANISTVPMKGAYVSSLVIDKYHVSGYAKDSDRTINVTAVISNKDLLVNATSVKIQLMDDSNSKVAESTTFDSESGIATATFIMPGDDNPWYRYSHNYTVEVLIDDNVDKTTARINVSNKAELSYTSGEYDYYGESEKWTPHNYLLTKDSEASELSVNKIQKAYSSLTSSSKIDVQLKGRDLDVGSIVLQYYTLWDKSYGDPINVDTSVFAWTATEGDNDEKTLNFTIPYPQEEGIYKLKILIDGTVLEGYYQTNWSEQGVSSSGYPVEVYNTIQVYGKTKITSFNIPKASISKAGAKVAATIKGVNFTIPEVTAENFNIACENSTVIDGATVTVVDDNTLTVCLNIPEVVGVYPVTVSVGGKSITADFDVKDYTGINVGDFILKDGKTLSKDTELTAEQKESVVALVCGFDPRGAMLGVGLKQEKLQWAPDYTEGYLTKKGYRNKKFSDIVVKSDKVGMDEYYYAGNAEITGDLEGRDNWEYVKSKDPEGAAEAETYYPAFNFAATYGTKAGLTGELTTGWFIPSLAELCEIYKNIKVLQKSLSMVSGTADFYNATWWSSNLSDNYWYGVYGVLMRWGQIVCMDQYLERTVSCIRAF